MSNVDRERMRKEAADAVPHRPPASSDARIEEALRRYLESSMVEMTKRGKDEGHSAGSAPPEPSLAAAAPTRPVRSTMNGSARRAVWPAFLVLALLFLSAGDAALYGVVVPVAALGLVLVVPGFRPRAALRIDRRDLAVVLALYIAVVGVFWLAFRVFTQDHTIALFLAFGAGMLLGVVGPIAYTVWVRHRPLSELGLTRHNMRAAVSLGLLLAAIQFGLTLWGYDLPRPVDWVPLTALALAVGLFETVFFRGFVQTRLEESFGSVTGVGGAAFLYSGYHVGYGMGTQEMLFLFGLGVVYSVAFALVRNVLVLWPLLVPMGSFFNNVRSGDIQMPWASIIGFVDVLALMATAVWLAARHERGRRRREAHGERSAVRWTAVTNRFRQ